MHSRTLAPSFLNHFIPSASTASPFLLSCEVEKSNKTMTKRIHPSTKSNNMCRNDQLLTKASVDDGSSSSTSLLDQDLNLKLVLTVWKRSSMRFQGTDGFTVFDQFGGLAFRVDNYSRKNQPYGGVTVTGGAVLLMDGAGKPLLTLKPKIFSMQLQWDGYRGGDEDGLENKPKTHIFSMRRRSSSFRLHNSVDDEAEVFMGGLKNHSPTPDFKIEGSFHRRNCKIRSTSGALVANIARKKVNSTILLSDDVFSLTIQPGFDSELIMAFLIILDRICSKPYAPALCS